MEGRPYSPGADRGPLPRPHHSLQGRWVANIQERRGRSHSARTLIHASLLCGKNEEQRLFGATIPVPGRILGLRQGGPDLVFHPPPTRTDGRVGLERAPV
jgi:hypothetical protein